jgi:hypothetical protein
MAEIDFRNILPGQLNPDLTPVIGSPIARSSNITDDPMSVYRRSIKNVFAPNIFENVAVLRAIVLYVYQTPGQPILGNLPLRQRSRDERSDATSVHLVQYGLEAGDEVYIKCMIPEVHLHNPNPFEANDAAGFLSISDTFYPAYRVTDKMVASDCKGLMPGSIIEVRFDDPNRSIGYVSMVVNRATNHILGDLIQQNSARGAFNGASPATTPYPGEESSSEGDLDPTFAELLNNLLDSVFAEYGYTFTIERTFRSEERQEFYKDQGWSSVTRGQHNNVDSSGNPAALAADVNVIGMPTPGTTGTGPMGADEAAAYIALRDTAPTFGLRTGGAYSTTAPNGEPSAGAAYGLGWDPFHIEYAPPRSVQIASDVGVSDPDATEIV